MVRRQSTPGPRAVVLAATLALATSAALSAQTTLFDVGPTGAMVSACAGLQNGNGWSPGGLVSMIAARSTCNSGLTAQPNAVVGASASYEEPNNPVKASAQGQAQLGQMKLASSYEANSSQGFTIGVLNAGWNSTQTILPANPADIGQIAQYVFDIHVHGTLDAPAIGFNSGVGISLVALRDDGSFGSTWSAQGNSNQFQAFHRDLDEIVSLYVAVPLGTPFELGVYAGTWSGVPSSAAGDGAGSTDLLGTLTWMGIRSVNIGGREIEYTISSTDGIDWTRPFAAGGPSTAVPAPATPLLALTGLLALVSRRRRAGRAASHA